MSDPFDCAYILQDTFARTAKAVDEVTGGPDAFWPIQTRSPLSKW
jgi:hypothetical protein